MPSSDKAVTQTAMSHSCHLVSITCVAPPALACASYHRRGSHGNMRAFIALMLIGGVAAGHERTGRYFVQVRNVIEVEGVKSGFVDQAKALLIDELKRHDAFTLEWPGDLPSDNDEAA